MLQFKIETSKAWNEDAAKACPDWGGLTALIFSDKVDAKWSTFTNLGLPKGTTDLTQQQKDWLKKNEERVETATAELAAKACFDYKDKEASKAYRAAWQKKDLLLQAFCRETGVKDS